MNDADRRYKDRIRHGGRREELLGLLKNFGKPLFCPNCGEQKEESELTCHHLASKDIHELQILLCRSCHAKVHKLGVISYSEEEREEIKSAIESSKTLQEAACKLGFSKYGFRYKRKKYGLLQVPCKICSKLFTPNKKILHFCSTECARLGFKKERQDYYKRRLEKNPNFLKERYERNKGNDLERSKKYAEMHKEQLREYRRLYYLKKKQKPTGRDLE